MVAVLSLSTQTFLGHNQETYQALRQALHLSLRRQLLLVICDDSELQSQLLQRLASDLGDGQSSPLVTLHLDGQKPDLVRQILMWLKQHRRLPSSSQVVPTFQILGIETLARQSLTVQNRFLASLSQVDTLLTQLDCRLVVWLSRPWLGKIRQSVPGFWRSRSGLFEFVGDPTPANVPESGTASTAKLNPDLQQVAPQPEPPTPALALPPELLQDPTLISYSHYLQELEEAQAGPLTRARAYLAAAQLCRNRIETGATTPATLDFAISLYQQAMPGLPEGELDWCDALNDLASLYWLHGQLEHHPEVISLWLNRSVAAYRQALTGAQATVPATNLKRLYTNLGTVYGLLANVEDPLTALQQSVRAFHQALQTMANPEEAEDYADLQNSLGSAYWRLAQLDRPPAYLHKAIAAYREAVHQRSPETHPQDYAMLHNNLGIAYWSLAQHERPVFWLEEAIAAYRAALAYRTVATTAAGCAATQNNLGTAYWDLAQHQRQQPQAHQESLALALGAYQVALQAAQLALQQDPDTSLGFDLAATCHSAGVVQDQLVQVRSGGQPSDCQAQLQLALDYYLQAYQGWQQQPQQLDILGQAVAHHLQITFDRLGMGAQQTSLSRLPGELLARVLPG